MIIRLFVIALLSLVTISCNSGSQNAGNRKKPGKEEMADLNRYLITKDRERIENYIARKNLDMTETQSGLWYMIKTEGTGDYFTNDDEKCSGQGIRAGPAPVSSRVKKQRYWTLPGRTPSLGRVSARAPHSCRRRSTHDAGMKITKMMLRE